MEMNDRKKEFGPVKLGVILIAAGLILIAAIVGVFAFFFNGQEFSGNINDWGAFGSYIGGVLGTSISILALIGAVIAIYQQHKTDERVNKHTIAADLMRSIERLEDNIDQPLRDYKININYSDLGINTETNAFRILTGIFPPLVIASVIPRYNEEVILENFDKSPVRERLEKISQYEIFSFTCGKLRFMRRLLLQHKNLSGHNVITIYYEKKYGSAVKRLREAGYPAESWDDITDM